MLLEGNFRSLFSYWENPSTTTGGKSERKCYLACLSLLTETGHVWRRWISFNGWMSGLVMFADGWCFTWNVVGCWSLFTCCVSRGTWVMLVKEIFCACGRVLKLVLWGGRGVFVQMNAGLAGCLSFSFVLSGVWMLLDVSRETRRFYNNPFVSRETLFLLYDVPRMSMCFTWNAGWGG